MSVTSYEIGARFVYRTIKSLTTNPADSWVNSYEFKATVAGAEGELLTLGNVLIDFEKAFHRDTVQFTQFTISTWEPDSVPYDPLAFISVPLSTAGTVGPVGDNLSLDKALSVARVPLSGRFGHIFYRGVLNEADTEAPAGRSILTDLASTNSTIGDAITDSGLDAYIGAGSSPLQMVMINADGTQVRDVLGLVVRGVATLPTDHAWFNRRRITVP